METKSTMNYLQHRIFSLLQAGKSFRDMERAVNGKISHVSWSRYSKGQHPTHGKQLAILAGYFGCGIEDLLEPLHDRPIVANDCTALCESLPDTPIVRALIAEIPLLSEVALKQVLRTALQLQESDAKSELLSA